MFDLFQDDENYYSHDEWSSEGSNNLSLHSTLNKNQAEKENEAKIANLALHKDNFRLKQELRKQKDHYERQLAAVRKGFLSSGLVDGDTHVTGAPPNARKSDQDPTATFDGSGRKKQPLYRDQPNMLSEINVDIMLVRADVNFHCQDYESMQTHANNALLKSKQLGHSPTIARCHFKLGIALLHQRRFSEALEELNQSHACAGLFGITSTMIEEATDAVHELSVVPWHGTGESPCSASSPPPTGGTKSRAAARTTDTNPPKRPPKLSIPSAAIATTHRRSSLLGRFSLDDDSPVSPSSTPDMDVSTSQNHDRTISMGSTRDSSLLAGQATEQDALYKKFQEKAASRKSGQHSIVKNDNEDDDVASPNTQAGFARRSVSFDSQARSFSAASSIASGSDKILIKGSPLSINLEPHEASPRSAATFASEVLSFGSHRSRQPQPTPIRTVRAPESQTSDPVTPAMESGDEMDEYFIENNFGSQGGRGGEVAPETPAFWNEDVEQTFDLTGGDRNFADDDQMLYFMQGNDREPRGTSRSPTPHSSASPPSQPQPDGFSNNSPPQEGIRWDRPYLAADMEASNEARIVTHRVNVEHESSEPLRGEGSGARSVDSDSKGENTLLPDQILDGSGSEKESGFWSTQRTDRQRHSVSPQGPAQAS